MVYKSIKFDVCRKWKNKDLKISRQSNFGGWGATWWGDKEWWRADVYQRWLKFNKDVVYLGLRFL